MTASADAALPLPAAPTARAGSGSGPARSPWMVMRSVAFALFLRELKTRLGGRWWGLVWTVGEPLAGALVMLAIYSAASTHALAGIDALVFLLAGTLPFQLFKALALRGMEAIDANQGLLCYRQVRPIDTVLARAGMEVLLAALVTAAALALVAWLGHPVWPQRPLELLLYSVLLVALGVAIGLVAAVLTAGVLARARAVVRLGFMPLYMVSGVLFPLSALPQETLAWLMLNPLALLLEGLRCAFFGEAYRQVPDLSVATPLAWVLVAVPLALGLYRLRRDHLQTA